MKKFVLLCTIAIFTACSNDDSASQDSGEEPILGTWYFTEINNAGGLQVNDCSSQSSIEFKSDKTAISDFYSETDGECTLETSNAVWSKNGEKYNFVLPEFGPQSGIIEFHNNSSFSFYPDTFSSTNTNIVFEKRAN